MLTTNTSRVCAAACAALLATSLSSAVALAQDAPGDVLVFSGPVRVDRGETVTRIASFEGPTRIDGNVTGDVFAARGDVTVDGHVGGNVVALGGVVRLGPNAMVGGNLISPRAPVVARGAEIRGMVQPMANTPTTAATIVGQLASWLAITASLFILALLLALFVPRSSAESIYLAARRSPGRALGIGILTALALPLLATLAIATIVGIPFGLGLLAAFFFLGCVGYVTTGWIVGRRLAERRMRSWPHVAWLLVGLAIVRLVALVPILSLFVWFFAASFGFGALVLAVRHQRAISRRYPGGLIPIEATT